MERTYNTLSIEMWLWKIIFNNICPDYVVFYHYFIEQSTFSQSNLLK